MTAIDLTRAEAIAHAALPDSPGCYVLVADPETMRELGLDGSGPAALYVGKAEDSIHKRVSRTHLVKSRTGSSTLRRSIGALLRTKLALEPQPRSIKRTEKDIQNYKFDSAGEQRLSEWVAASIRVCGVASSDPATTESSLIRQLHPPLNLTKLGGWTNPDKEMIGRMRKECAELARKAAAGG